MPTSNKKKRPIEVSPAGVVIYAHLHKPQLPHPKNKSKDAKPKYNIEILLPIDDPKTKAWGASIKTIMPDAEKYPFKIDEGDKNREATGDLRVKFSSIFPCRIVDAKRNDLPPGRFPAAGSVVKVAYVADTYEVGNKGITLYLQGVQVLTLVEFERKALPFTDEEGFEWHPNDKSAPEDATGSNGRDTGGDRPPDGEPSPPEEDSDQLPF